MIRLFFILLFVAFCIFFAIENPASVSVDLGFYDSPSVSLGILVLGIGFFALLLGLFLGWLGEIRQRLRARRAEARVKSADKVKDVEARKIEELTAKIAELERTPPRTVYAPQQMQNALAAPKQATDLESDATQDSPRSLKERFIDKIL